MYTTRVKGTCVCVWCERCVRCVVCVCAVVVVCVKGGGKGVHVCMCPCGGRRRCRRVQEGDVPYPTPPYPSQTQLNLVPTQPHLVGVICPAGEHLSLHLLEVVLGQVGDDQLWGGGGGGGGRGGEGSGEVCVCTGCVGDRCVGDRCVSDDVW